MQKTAFYLALITSKLIPEIQAGDSPASTNQTSTINFVTVPPFPIAMLGGWFSYKNGGTDWANSTNTCGGQLQSPINLDSATIDPAPKGYTFQLFLINQANNSTCSIDQTINCAGWFSDLIANATDGTSLLYHGVGFQIHAPSEHFFNGQLYDAELQLIHQIDQQYANLTTSYYAIVSILFNSVDGKVSSFFDSLNLKNIKKMKKFNLFASLQPDYIGHSKYVMYQGSMTVPPCTENVNWFILTNPTPMSLQQLGDIDLIYRVNRAFARGRGNNRFLQPVNKRTVYSNTFVNNMAIDLSTSLFFSPILSAIGPVLAQQ